ncbi:MAG: DUF4465 domain-containing protein [Muribaculum sp.]|nr:DUF4465 domain-containing protein [Muribaculum sp.]
MKRLLQILSCGFALFAAATFTGCSSDEDTLVANLGDKPVSRASINGSTVTIDFEDMTDINGEDAMANPTSYGLNYYPETSGTQITDLFDMDGYFMSSTNSGVWPIGSGDYTQSFMFGGIALSDWAMTSNPSSNPNPGKPFTDEWWMSEYNQMSVYNTARTTTGNRGGAGANGSNNFGIVYGFDDSYGYVKEASFDIPNGPVTFKSIKICNTAYTYGVIQNGNVWTGENGVEVHAVSLKSSKGYFNLIIKCMDESGNVVKRIETPLADYRDNKDICITNWTEIQVNATNVSKIQFGFWGSDIQGGGPATPAYVAIDDIVFE